MKNGINFVNTHAERGAALVLVLLSLALLLALAMGITLTAISELGISNTYGTQVRALQAAEAGLNHAASLVANYQGADFTELLSERTSLSTDYLTGNNPFVYLRRDKFISGVVMIDSEHPTRGFQMRDANGTPIEDTYYRVSLIDDEPSTGTTPPLVPNFTPGSTFKESTGTDANRPDKDLNNRLVIYSTGTVANASATLEGWVAFLPYPAFSANGDIRVWGNADINGAYGGVHSNSNLEVGNSATIDQTATASGTATILNPGNIGGFFGGGQARLDIPPLVTTEPLTSGGPNTSPRMQDFLIREANRLLVDPDYANNAHPTEPNGTGAGLDNSATSRLKALAERLNVSYSSLAAALDQDNSNDRVDQSGPVAIAIVRAADGTGTATKIDTGSRITTDPSDIGWSYNNANGWNISNMSAGGFTYYVVGRDNYNLANPSSSTKNGGNVKITSNTGSPGNPLQITIMATGSIEISGNPNIVSNLRRLSTNLLPPFVRIDVLLVAIQDLKINGDTDGAQRFSGISYAGEQVELSGNGSFDGQVISMSNPNVTGTPVNGNLNTITGSFTLTLNSGSSIGRISLYSWRQIKR